MKKKYMFPVVVGVALAGYYFFIYKKSALTLQAPTDGTIAIDNAGGTGANAPVKVYTPTNPIPVIVNSVRDGYLRSLKMYISNPQYLAAFDQMTDSELASAWYYVGTYLNTGNPLNYSGDGGNPLLFNQIQAIHTKYGIF